MCPLLWAVARTASPTRFIFELLKYFNLGEPVAPFRRNMGHTSNYYDDRVMAALDLDVRHVWLGFTDLSGPAPDGGADAWGIRYQRAGIYTQAVTFPLENATLDTLEDYAFPNPDNLVRRDELRERACYLKEETDYAVVGRAFDSFGPFERASGLRRVDQLLMDLAVNPEFVERMVEKITDVLCRLAQIYVETAGEYLDILELPGDDYASQRLIISPKMFDRFFAPAFKRIIDTIKQGAPHIKVLYHSDGNMEPLLGRLADLGVDIFHCLEPLPGVVDMAAVKQKTRRPAVLLGRHRHQRSPAGRRSPRASRSAGAHPPAGKRRRLCAGASQPHPAGCVRHQCSGFVPRRAPVWALPASIGLTLSLYNNRDRMETQSTTIRGEIMATPPMDAS